MEACRQALTLEPHNLQANFQLGNIHQATQNKTEAKRCYETALTLDPNHSDSHLNLAGLLRGMDLYGEALHHAQQAINLSPQSAPSFTTLGAIHQDLGEMDEALACYRKARDLRRQFPQQENAPLEDKNLLCALLYQPEMDNRTLFEAHLEQVNLWLPETPPPLIDPQAPIIETGSERLRVGYLSSDFYAHPVGINISQLLKGLGKFKLPKIR